MRLRLRRWFEHSLERLVRGLELARLDGASELLDGSLAAEERLRNLRDLARVNRWLGGTALTRSALVRLLAGRHQGRRRLVRRGPAPLRLLDVGTGAADIPASLLAWARRHRLALEIEAVDRQETIDAAHGMRGEVPGLKLVVGDALVLPYADASFDVVHASLVTHHLDPRPLRSLLEEMRRVSRGAVIVNDLDRGRLWLACAILLARLFTSSPVSRHDGPMSVRRAYHPWELAQLASRSGLLEIARVQGFLGHRYALVFAVPERSSVQQASEDEAFDPAVTGEAN
jgi:ubiquinone/menaquinone biosynthesis C-methylase UbiE